MTNFELMRDRLQIRAGIYDRHIPKDYDFATLQKTQWSPEFEQYMRNRLIMGALRYGLLLDKKKKRNKYDLLGAIKSKVQKYVETGNKEYLVDIANYCLLEFECNDHPKAHFHALDEHHDHCKLK